MNIFNKKIEMFNHGFKVLNFVNFLVKLLKLYKE